MAKAIGLIFLLALTACSGVPQSRTTPDPCQASGETSIACQDYRYSRAF